MPLIDITPELKSLLLFSAAGAAIGGLSVLVGRASLAGILGIAVLYGLRKLAKRVLGLDSAALMQSGVMPYLTFWYAVWVILINA